jgi:hypothetical protein
VKKREKERERRGDGEREEMSEKLMLKQDVVFVLCSMLFVLALLITHN